MSFWTPIENPGTRPPRSWAFDIGCALLAAVDRGVWHLMTGLPSLRTEPV